MKQGSVKVKDGKMVKLKIEVNEEKVEGVELRGDFFLQPPKMLGELEEKIAKLDTEASPEEVKERLESVDAEMIGFSPEDVGKAFRKAFKGENQ